MKTYLYDIKMFASVRIQAESEEAGRQWIRDNIHCGDANLGAGPDGEPIVVEISVDDDEIPCVEGEDE